MNTHTDIMADQDTEDKDALDFLELEAKEFDKVGTPLLPWRFHVNEAVITFKTHY